MTKHKMVLLTVENITVWGGFALAISEALPYIQFLAGTAAFIFSVLSIIKMLKHWNEAVKK